MSGSVSSSSSGMMKVDTKTLPRIGGVHKDAEIWKFKITDWFKREGITSNETKFIYYCCCGRRYYKSLERGTIKSE